MLKKRFEAIIASSRDANNTYYTPSVLMGIAKRTLGHKIIQEFDSPLFGHWICIETKIEEKEDRSLQVVAIFEEE